MAARAEGQGGIGLLALSLMTVQPIIKDKLDIWVAGRRTYADQVAKRFGQELPYYFYDVNAKVIYRPSAKDRIEFSHYSGDDILQYARQPRDTSSRRRNVVSDF